MSEAQKASEVHAVIDEAFKKFTRYRFVRGMHKVECVKGLFGVEAPTKEQAMSEARHYFVQYFEDGEYSGGLIND